MASYRELVEHWTNCRLGGCEQCYVDVEGEGRMHMRQSMDPWSIVLFQEARIKELEKQLEHLPLPKAFCSCGCGKQARMYFANKSHALDHMRIGFSAR